jgi:nitroimidazol reductase NimA-like FMN-containing flavoprotein (pyridoxamine 5'-phosphate oxidase superfamily)
MTSAGNGNGGAAVRPEIVEYIGNAPWAVLATVREDGAPVVRTMANFATGAAGAEIYFSTGKEADKTRQIRKNGRVSFLFQHEGQQIPSFRNVAAVGDADPLSGGVELDRAAEALSARSPHFRGQVEREGIGSVAVYRVRVSEIRFLDFGRGFGPESVETIRIAPAGGESRP